MLDVMLEKAEKVSWSVRVRNGEVLHRVKDSSNPQTAKKRTKAD